MNARKLSSPAKSTGESPEDEAIIIERMNEALKRMMHTPPETHKEMVERRRGKQKRARPPKGKQA